MPKKIIHILGGGQWQVPTVRLARELGYEVLVTDMYQERPAYALADHHEVCDISDQEATLKIAQAYRVDGIVCDTTDVGVPTAAYVAQQLGLRGLEYQTALNFTDKYLMRKLTAEAGIQNVACELVETIEGARAAAERFGYPFIIKPVDNQSSRGVHRVNSSTELATSFEDARRNSRRAAVLAEEFLDGTEVTVEGFGFAGTYYTLGISDKAHFAHRPEVASRLTYPAAFSPQTLDLIRSTNEGVAKTLGLTTGVTHAEYMVKEGSVRLVEIAARGGGSRIYSHIAPHLSGLNVPKLYLQYLMGEAIEVVYRPQQRAANLEFFQFPAGRVTKIRGVEEAQRLQGVNELFLEFGVGDTLLPPSDDRSRPGFMVVFGRTRDEVLAISQTVKATVQVDVQ